MKAITGCVCSLEHARKAEWHYHNNNVTVITHTPSLRCCVDWGRDWKPWSLLDISCSTLSLDSSRGLGRWCTTICRAAWARGSHWEQIAHSCTLGSVWRRSRAGILSCRLLMILPTLSLSLHTIRTARCSEGKAHLVSTASYTDHRLSNTNCTNRGFFPLF